jgi:hypothetical protein
MNPDGKISFAADLHMLAVLPMRSIPASSQAVYIEKRLF